MLEITAAQAHSLKPVVSISQNGLTDSVLTEINRCLDSHELIKIRVYNDDRDERERLIETICQQLAAAPVQHIGKLLIIWRPAPAKSASGNPRPGVRRRTGPRRTKRSFQA